MADTRVQCMSGLYRNPPLGPQDQPDYVNAVAAILTRLAPHSLLRALQEIERSPGSGAGRAPALGSATH